MSIYNSVVIKNPELLPKLAEVLDLILKKTKPGTAAYTFKRSQFKGAPPLGRRCVNLVNECLLNHRFEEAAKLLWIMCQDRSCFNLILYKDIMVVLENLISCDDIQIVKSVSSDFRKLDVLNKLEIHLEYLIFALKKDLNGSKESFYLEGKNAGKGRMRIIPHIDRLYSAYAALVNYIKWVNICQGDQSSQANKDLALSIVNTLKLLIQHPGVWDIFVLKIVEMLEYYELYDETDEVLKKYADCNPEHVNAYIYLCVYLHKHNADQEVFVKYAKVLCNLCPSDERVLLLVQRWQYLGKNMKKSIKILFNFFDYPVNGNKVLGWHLFFINLHQAMSSKKSSVKKLLNSSWRLRRNSWSHMHFSVSNICTENFELLSWKAKVLVLFESEHEYISHVQEKFPMITTEHLLQSEISIPTSEEFRTLYDVNDEIRSR